MKGMVCAKAFRMEEIGQGVGALNAKGRMVQEEARAVGSAR